MANDNRIKQLRKTLKDVLSYQNKEMITRREEWGPISFVAAEKEIKTTFKLANDLLNLPLEYLSDQTADEISTSLANLLPQLKEIDSFTIAAGDPSNRCKGIVDQIHHRVNIIYSSVAIWIPYLAYQRGDVSENIAKLASILEEARQKADLGIAQIEAKNKEVASVLVKVREVAAEAGAAVFTEDFQREADANRVNSWWWLSGTIILGLSALGIAIFAYYDDYSQYTTALSLWPKLACRFLLLSLCFTAAMWCGRIYMATRHLSILNRHRALSLKTFQAFSAAASDSHTKDAVLLETTHSIFGNVSTGLIGDSCNSESEPNIIQIAGKVLEQTSSK
jgi:hypothetical protein